MYCIRFAVSLQRVILLKEINMAAVSVRQNQLILDAYWKNLQSLSNDLKLKLAAKLTTSVIEDTEKKTSEKTQNMLDKYSGAWVGEESAEDIMKMIKEGSTSREPLDF